jgi:hypothetical protein
MQIPAQAQPAQLYFEWILVLIPEGKAGEA